MKRTALVIMIVWTLSIEVLVSSHQVCFIGSVYDQRADNQRRWFLPYENPCDCTAIRLGGMTVGDPSCLQVAPYYLRGLFLSENPEEIWDFLDCPVPSPAAQGRVSCSGTRPLGLKDGTIPDDRITASSSLESFAAYHGRIDYDGFWRPLNNDSGSWIEVDLIHSTLVYGVTTQGSNTDNHFRVTQYRVAYQQPSSPDSPLEYVKNDKGEIELFAGNVGDADVEITNWFVERILATRVRIEPENWSTKIALRFELFGCSLDH